MKANQSATHRHRIGASLVSWASRYRRILAAVAFIACTGAIVWAQQAPLPYCYGTGSSAPCFASRSLAEQAMRADANNASIWNLLEHTETRPSPALGKAGYVYTVKNQPAAAVYGPSFVEENSSGGIVSTMHDCTPGSDPNMPDGCLDENQLVNNVMQELRDARPDCAHTGPTFLADRTPPYKSITPYENGIGSKTYGVIDFGQKEYRATRNCNGDVSDFTIRISRYQTYKCPVGYERVGDTNGPGNGVDDRVIPTLCKFKPDGMERIIVGPIEQCASCAASPYPLYPATGEKARTEPDFMFAGRTFTRYYHSLRQFRPNVGFAEGWSHTFGDQLMLAGTAPAGLVDETGAYEYFDRVSTYLYRGQNSTDKFLEYRPGKVERWRLRLPDGEVHDFNANGQLIAIRDADDPRFDVTLVSGNGPVITATDGQGRVLRFEYNADQLMSRVILPDGSTIAYGYDSAKNLIFVDYGGGLIKRYHYDEAGLVGDPSQRHHLTGITAETGRRFASFRYDARGRAIESRVFGMPNHVTTVSYDSDTQATVTSASGEQRVFTIQPGLYRRITGVSTVGETKQDVQTFDTLGRLSTQTDRRDALTTYGYDPTNGYLSAVTEAVGTPEQRREEIVRDLATNLVTERRTLDAAGIVKAKSTWTYNVRGQVLTASVIDPVSGEARTATTTYCEAVDVSAGACPVVGLVRSVDGPLLDTEQFKDSTDFEYRAADAPGCALSPSACTWRKGDLWKIVNAKAQVTEILAHDGAGRVTSVRDVNGVVTDFEYDLLGRPVAGKVRGTNDSSESDDRIERLEYTADGFIHRSIQPDGNYLTFEYDDGQRLIAIVDRNGNRIAYTLDGAGQRIQEDVRDASGVLQQTLSRTFDTFGRLKSVKDANEHATVFDYDAGGLLTTVTDVLGRQATRSHDPLGRVISSVDNATSATESSETAYRYDALDQITRITDPKGLNTDYRYDAFGGVLELDSPDTGLSTMSYDAAGNAVSEIDANGKSTSYLYDALDRLKTVDYAAAVPDEPLNYDLAWGDCPAGEQYAIGRLGRFADATGSTVLCYNRFGDITRKVQRSGTSTLKVRWVYEASGRLQKMVYPDNTEVDYLYDTQGRVTEIGVTGGGFPRRVLLTGASYHPFGPIKRWTYGNGLELRRSLDLDGRPFAVEDGPESGTGPGISLRYTYDAVGRPVTLRSGHGAAGVEQSYQYDGLDRLHEVQDATGLVLERYTYDGTGDRLTSGEWVQTGTTGGGPGGGGTPTYSFQTLSYDYAPDSHHLLSVGGEPRQYDDAGNLVSVGDPNLPGGPRQQFAYNDAERLGTVSSTEPIATYGYNALGERVKQTVYSTTAYSTYDQDGNWLGDFNSYGAPERMAIWLDGLPVGLLVGNGSAQTLYYIEADALGSPRAVIDPARNVAVWQWDALGDAYGRDYPQEDPDGDGVVFNLDMRLPGQRFDAVSGLHYNGFRDFDPSTGRYIESDPLGLDAGPSTYGYANGSPMAYSDPDGLIAGLVLRVAARYIVPRLSARLAVRASMQAALRAAKKEAAQAARLAARAARPKPIKVPGICKSSSEKLGKALEAAGHIRPPGSAAHHIVAGNANIAAPARTVLQKFGIEINSAANGVFLPANRTVAGVTRAAIHSEVHSRAYYQAVNQAIQTATTRAEAEAILNSLRQSLLSGGL